MLLHVFGDFSHCSCSSTDVDDDGDDDDDDACDGVKVSVITK